MATENNKKYYYMKLKEDFFRTDEMLILESMQDGYLYSNILLKMYLKSLKYNGQLSFGEYIPCNSKVISQLVGHPVGVVEAGLRAFENLGLIEVLDDGAIYMRHIQQYIGKSSTEAERIKQYRQELDKKKLLESKEFCQK